MFFRRDSQYSIPPRQSVRPARRSSGRERIRSRCLRLESLEARQVLAATFEAMGPAPAIHGGTEKVSPDNEVSGAIHTVVAHPTNADVVYIGAANGGVWRTNNATATRPNWVPLTDHLPSLTVGAMAMDPNDPTRLVVGMGQYSAFADGGPLSGLLLTEDGGSTWKQIRDPLLVGKNISGVTINGPLILASAGGGNFSSDPEPSTGGIFRSTDGGETWQNIELFARLANFPDEPVGFEVFDLVADPTNAQRYYAGVADEGIYRTDDGGVNWSNATSGDARIEQLLDIVETNNLDLNNMEMDVANNGRIYAAIITEGQPLYIGYSDSFGGTWTEMDIPLTLETGGPVGISPRPKPAGRGNIHFSIKADPNDPFTVYVGGDRQDGNLSFQSGNSIGARDFTGKLFRGDTRHDPIGNVLDVSGFIPFLGYSPQWEHLTHSNLIAEMPEGGTRRGSAPHADSREMAFDANGDLIQVDDGGIYRRTDPLTNQGDWYSMNGNVQVTEIHDIAYDSVSNILVAGTQDNGAVQQLTSNGKRWEVVELLNQTIEGVVERSSPGDGGDVAVDDTSLAGHSIRYSSAQSLGALRRQVYNANNDLVSETLLTPNIIGNFVTPVVLNKNNPTRMAIGGSFGIFESFDRGDSFREVFGPDNVSFGIIGVNQMAVAYGGSRGGQANPAALWIGSDGEVFVRTSQQENLRLTRAQFPGGFIWDLAVDTADWANAYVIDQDNVYVTTNTGDSWKSITGNLGAVGAGRLRSLEFVRRGSEAFIIVGTDAGAFVTSDRNPGRWTELGRLPHALLFDMEYDAKDNVLAVGTMGRGAFLMRNAFEAIRSAGTGSGTQTATARGLVWKDLDGDGQQDGNEPGVRAATVYVDLNGDNQMGVNEPAGITGTNGGYVISDVPAGTFAVRVIVQPGWVQTAPTGGEHVVNFTKQLQSSGLDFGLREGSGGEMGFDYGDAPAPFPTLQSSNGASHGIVPGFQLGELNDGDGNGSPSADADGDDTRDQADEDGVRVTSDLVPGSSSIFEITIRNGAQPPGVLQGWIDFDGDGRWTTPGEQIFTDLAVREGVNRIQVNVPNWAVLGETFARFRYGYERGISFRGRAVAGEVEDYRLDIVRGGPTAVDDDLVVRRNSINNQLNILTNDTLPPGSDSRIHSVTNPSAGGVVQIAPNGGSLIYTPRNGFTGTETFRYTLRDRNGLTDTAQVSVFVQPDVVAIRLAATDSNGTPITSVTVGDTFQLHGYVQDLRPGATGVFAAYMDVDYPSAVATVSGAIEFGAEYPNGQSGATSTPGLIDEVGAFDGFDRLGADETLLFSVPIEAVQAGSVTFTTNPADVLPQHSVLVFDNDDPVPTNQIEYRSLTLSFTQAIAARTNPRNALDVNDDTSISPIDALLVINELNDATVLGARAEGEGNTVFLDVSSDGAVSPLDALLVINALNQQNDVAGSQASSVSAMAAAVDSTMSESTSDSLGPRDDLQLPTTATDGERLDVVGAAHLELFAAEYEDSDEESSVATKNHLDQLLAEDNTDWLRPLS